MPANWRLLGFSQADAAMNMAIDEAILESHRNAEQPPTLRLYGFAPPAVTIGYAQRLDRETIDRIREHGFDLARRPTGGRAVLHLDDLTYCFVASSNAQGGEEPILKSGVNAAYKQICQGLINAFARFGLNLSLGQASRAYKEQNDCFMATTGADLHVGGKKMIGSAQVRRQHAVAQHGSILLKQDQSLMTRLLSAAPAQSEKIFQDRHANLFQVLGKILTIEELEQALRLGFEEAFAVRFEYSQLSAAEVALAEKLRSQYVID